MVVVKGRTFFMKKRDVIQKVLLSRVVEDEMKNGIKSRQKKTGCKKGLEKTPAQKAAQKKKKRTTHFLKERERERKKKAKQQKP